MLLAELLFAAAVTATLTTPDGPIELELLPGEAPQATATFVALARQGFYDGTRFHRAVPGHSVVAGAPKGQSAGGPGYCVRPDPETPRRHTAAGLVAMVVTAGTFGSQFLITLGAAADLDGRAPVFATVTKGQDIVQKMADQLAAARDATTTIDKVEVKGEYAPPPVARVPEPDAAALAALLGPKAKELAAGAGKTLGLGRLDAVTMHSGRSRCADAQALFHVSFQQAPDARLLIYATAGEGSAEVRQFQFEKAAAP